MPFGGFVSKIGVFFSTRPDNDVPVQMEIRPLENGVPSQTQVLPGSITSVNRDDVVIPGDTNNLTSVQGAETQFVFDEPVYLEPGTSYAFVISADTLAYNAVSLFQEKKITSIIVTEENKVIGALNIHDLFRAGLM